MIEDQIWQAQRENLIKQAGLEAFKKYEMLNNLKQQLNEKYRIVNKNFLEGRNPYLSFDKKSEYVSALLKQGGYMPILKVLTEIDRIAYFEKCFKHHGIKHTKYRPRLETFIAGIIGLGCNIGIPKMAQISTGVNENTLTNTVTWYFNKKTLHDANQQIIKVIHALVLSNVFIAEQHELHSASDGSRFNVGVESLIANYSFKYFGKDKGVSVYTFINERQVLFHSLVMSSSDREAAYVIDGLNNNNVTKTQIHSTDTHGYTELIFASTYFLAISFAPRLKNIGKQNIYGFSSYNDVKLRQRIEKQLSRIELSNRFSRAVFYANNGEFMQGTPEDQEIAVACKVLIQNAIILWNYLYLSQLLANCNDAKERNEMISMIKHGSIINWGHINLYGAFTFRRQITAPAFDMKKILSLKIAS